MERAEGAELTAEGSTAVEPRQAALSRDVSQLTSADTMEVLSEAARAEEMARASSVQEANMQRSATAEELAPQVQQGKAPAEMATVTGVHAVQRGTAQSEMVSEVSLASGETTSTVSKSVTERKTATKTEQSMQGEIGSVQHHSALVQQQVETRGLATADVTVVKEGEVVERPINFTAEATQQLVPRGQTAKFEVQMSAQPETVKWYVNSREIIANDKFQLLSTATYCSLMILDVVQEDEGEYKLIVTNKGGQRYTAITHLNVGEAPTIVRPLESQVAKEGARVEMECYIESRPLPTKVYWLVSNKEVVETKEIRSTFTSGVCTLLIECCRPSDAAQYTCKVESELGYAESSATLLIQEEGAPEMKITRVTQEGECHSAEVTTLTRAATLNLANSVESRCDVKLRDEGEELSQTVLSSNCSDVDLFYVEKVTDLKETAGSGLFLGEVVATIRERVPATITVNSRNTAFMTESAYNYDSSYKEESNTSARCRVETVTAIEETAQGGLLLGEIVATVLTSVPNTPITETAYTSDNAYHHESYYQDDVASSMRCSVEGCTVNHPLVSSILEIEVTDKFNVSPMTSPWLRCDSDSAVLRRRNKSKRGATSANRDSEISSSSVESWHTAQGETQSMSTSAEHIVGESRYRDSKISTSSTESWHTTHMNAMSSSSQICSQTTSSDLLSSVDNQQSMSSIESWHTARQDTDTSSDFYHSAQTLRGSDTGSEKYHSTGTLRAHSELSGRYHSASSLRDDNDTSSAKYHSTATLTGVNMDEEEVAQSSETSSSYSRLLGCSMDTTGSEVEDISFTVAHPVSEQAAAVTVTDEIHLRIIETIVTTVTQTVCYFWQRDIEEPTDELLNEVFESELQKAMLEQDIESALDKIERDTIERMIRKGVSALVRKGLIEVIDEVKTEIVYLWGVNLRHYR